MSENDVFDGNSAQGTPQGAPSQGDYTRPRRHHVTQPPVNSLAEDDLEKEYVHDSNFVNGRGPIGDRAYRRSRQDIATLKRDSPYGQYLSVPKGRRQIFASRERRRRLKAVLALFVVVAILVAVALVLWNMVQGFHL